MEAKGAQIGEAQAAGGKGPSASLPPASETELSGVHGIFSTLVKTAKIIQLYPSDNAIYRSFTHDLELRFTAFLEEYQELPIDVMPGRLCYKRREMLSEQGEHQNALPSRLFRDGIRRLVFYAGVTGEELLELLDVIGRPPDPDDLEDDIVTLLWERDFAHIQYFVLDTDIDETAALSTDMKLGHEVHNLLKLAELQDIVPGEGELAEGEDGTSLPGETQKAKKRPAMLSPDAMSQVMSVSEHDREALCELVSHDHQRDLRHDLTTLLFEIFSFPGHEDSLPENCRVLGVLVRGYVQEERIREALEVLEKFRELQASDPPPEHHQAIEEQIQELIAPETLETLGRLVERENVEHPGELLGFIRLLGPIAENWLLDLIPKVRDRKLAHRCIDEMAGDDPASLFERLSNRDPVILRRLIETMGTAGSPDTARYLLPYLKRGDLLIRMESIGALARIGGPVARSALLKTIEDPEAQIRLAIMRALGAMEDPTILPALYARVNARTFHRMPLGEKQELFNAIARTGGESALPYLAKLIEKRRIFRRQRWTDLMVCAAQALTQIPLPNALRVAETRLEGARGEVANALRKSILQLRDRIGKASGKEGTS